MAIPKGDGYGSQGSCGQATVVATQTATASDFTFDPWTRAISIQTGGLLTMKVGWETASALYPLAAGWHAIRVQTIYSTDSTAQGVVAWW